MQDRLQEAGLWCVSRDASATSQEVTECTSSTTIPPEPEPAITAELSFKELHTMLAAKYEQLVAENHALVREGLRHRPNAPKTRAPSDAGMEDDAEVNNGHDSLGPLAFSGQQAFFKVDGLQPSLPSFRSSFNNGSGNFDARARGAGCGCAACKKSLHRNASTFSETSMCSEVNVPIRQASKVFVDHFCGLCRRRQKKRHQTLQDALSPTSVRIARTSPWVINPEQSTLLQTWDKLTMAALAFVAFVTPFQVSMLSDVRLGILLFVNFFIDLIFFFDMCLQFFIMYQVPTKYGYVLEHRHEQIIRHYVKTWFVIDFFSTLPFDLLGILVGGTGAAARAVKLVRLMRLLKLVRILRASRVFRRIEVRMSVTYQRLALVKFFVMLMLITHWMSCLWALSLLYKEDSEIPHWVDSFDEMEMHVEDKTRDTPWKKYIACFYFTSYTITSVGYGDIGPQNIVERIICTFMIFVSGISWALVLAQVTGIVGHMDASEQDFRKVMDELNFFMEDRKLPPIMRHRLRFFFLANKTVRRRESQEWVLERMSPSLKGEVFMEMNQVWMRQINFLRDIMDQDESHTCSRLTNFLTAVAQTLSTEVHAQMEIFGNKRTIYILCRGIVARNSRVFLRGAVWGLDGFLLSSASSSLVEPVKSLALSYVEVLVFSLGNFQQVHEQHQHMCPEVSQTLRWHCRWLALQRTIWAEAARRRQGGREGHRPKLKRKRRPLSLTANLQ